MMIFLLLTFGVLFNHKGLHKTLMWWTTKWRDPTTSWTFNFWLELEECEEKPQNFHGELTSKMEKTVHVSNRKRSHVSFAEWVNGVESIERQWRKSLYSESEVNDTEWGDRLPQAPFRRLFSDEVHSVGSVGSRMKNSLVQNWMNGSGEESVLKFWCKNSWAPRSSCNRWR